MEKNNKKAPSKGHGHRISDGNEGSYSIKLPSKREGSFQEKRKKDDNVINPPKENTRKK